MGLKLRVKWPSRAAVRLASRCHDLQKIEQKAGALLESDRHRQGELSWSAGIMSLQEAEKKAWHLSALGAALAQLVGYIIGDVARPSFVSVERDYPNGIVALTF